MYRIECRQDYKHSDFIAMCVNVTKVVPVYLSHCKTYDAIDTTNIASCSSNRIFKAIISAVIPDGCVPQFTKPVKETHLLEDATNFIYHLIMMMRGK